MVKKSATTDTVYMYSDCIVNKTSLELAYK